METVIHESELPFKLGTFGYSTKQCAAIYAIAAERFNQANDGYQYTAYTYCIEKTNANDSEFLYVGKVVPQKEADSSSLVVAFRNSNGCLDDLIARTIESFYRTL